MPIPNLYLPRARNDPFAAAGIPATERARKYWWNPTIVQEEFEKAKGAKGKYTTGDPFDLAAQTNEFMAGQARAPFEANLPDYTSMVAQRSANIGAGLRGEVPTDVTNLLAQQAAERGIGGGQAASSPNANAAWLQALGLTSLGVKKQAGQELGEAIAQTPVPELFNPASIFVPERFADKELEEYRRRSSPTVIRRTSWAPGAFSQPKASSWNPSLFGHPKPVTSGFSRF